MARILVRLGGVVLALVLGLGSAVYVGSRTLDQAAIANGPWRVLLNAGNEDAGFYERTAVALGGLFALSRTETLYYSATTDSAGEPLNEFCDYRVVGTDPDTRWWSLTAYARDNYLIRNGDEHHAIAKTTVAREADGSFVIRVSGEPKDRNWISSRHGTAFILMLRLYNPGDSVSADPGGATLPVIEKEGC